MIVGGGGGRLAVRVAAGLCGVPSRPMCSALPLGYGCLPRGCWCRLFVRLMVGARTAKAGLGRAGGTWEAPAGIEEASCHICVRRPALRCLGQQRVTVWGQSMS